MAALRADLGTFFDRHAARLHGYFLLRTAGDRSQAEDLTQEGRTLVTVDETYPATGPIQGWDIATGDLRWTIDASNRYCSPVLLPAADGSIFCISNGGMVKVLRPVPASATPEA